MWGGGGLVANREPGSYILRWQRLVLPHDYVHFPIAHPVQQTPAQIHALLWKIEAGFSNYTSRDANSNFTQFVVSFIKGKQISEKERNEINGSSLLTSYLL